MVYSDDDLLYNGTSKSEIGYADMTSEELHEILKQVWLRDISADDAFDDIEPILNELNSLTPERD